MKKFVLGFAFILTFLCLLPGQKTQAQGAPTIEQSNNETQAATDAAQVVEYSLPYPGILPDNPLYFLKAARDRLVSILISDSQKKAEFNILTSDKRISSAWMLANSNKDELAVSTLSKSNNYMDLAISSVAASKRSGKKVNAIIDTIKNSIGKHLEVATQIEKKVDKKYSAQVISERTRLINFDKSVGKL